MTALEETRAVCQWLESEETRQKLQDEGISIDLTFVYPTEDSKQVETHYIGDDEGSIATTVSVIAGHMEYFDDEKREEYFQKLLDFLDLYVDYTHEEDEEDDD